MHVRAPSREFLKLFLEAQSEKLSPSIDGDTGAASTVGLAVIPLLFDGMIVASGFAKKQSQHESSANQAPKIKTEGVLTLVAGIMGRPSRGATWRINTTMPHATQSEAISPARVVLPQHA